MKLTLNILIIFVFYGCVRETVINDIYFPTTVDSKAAVYCLLTPGDSIFVAVRAVQAINNESRSGTQTIQGAQIILENTNTGGQISIPYISKNGLYGCSQRDFPVLPDNTYRLSVRVNNLSNMQAVCHVPSRAAVIESSAYGESYQDTFGKRRRITLSWPDVSSSTNRYNYFVINQHTDQNNTITTTKFNDVITQTNSTFYYNDDTIDSGAPHTYYLFTADQNLYTFFSLSQKTNNILYRGTSTSDLFSGYQGVLPTFSNIENGYGVFGAYLYTSKIVKFL